MEILRTFELKLFGFMSTGNLIKEKEWFGSQLKSQIAMGYDLLTCEIRENSLAKGYALGVKNMTKRKEMHFLENTNVGTRIIAN